MGVGILKVDDSKLWLVIISVIYSWMISLRAKHKQRGCVCLNRCAETCLRQEMVNSMGVVSSSYSTLKPETTIINTYIIRGTTDDQFVGSDRPFHQDFEPSLMTLARKKCGWTEKECWILWWKTIMVLKDTKEIDLELRTAGCKSAAKGDRQKVNKTCRDIQSLTNHRIHDRHGQTSWLSHSIVSL